MKKTSIRGKLIVAFTLVAVVASVQTLIQFNYNQNVTEVDSFAHEVETLNSSLLEAQMYQSRFVLNDLTDDSFYHNGNSENLENLNSQLAKNKETLVLLKEHPISQKGGLSEELERIDSIENALSELYGELRSTSLILGFADFGLIGKMRSYAHILESDYSNFIPTSEILMLRRHEKDFLLRKNLKYRDRFKHRVASILSDLPADGIDKELASCRYLLKMYESSFYEVCDLKVKVGSNTEKKGLQGEIWLKTNQLLHANEALKSKFDDIAKRDLAELRYFFFLSLTLTTVVIIFVVLRLSKIMSRSLKDLSFRVNSFVRSNFEGTFRSESFEIRSDEIGDLYRNFKKLGEEVTIHFKQYRENAEAKHNEILHKNKQIEEQKSMLIARQSLISLRNKSLMDSLYYAKRIQAALLPNRKLLNTLLGDCILLFKPKDVVSGDFYWVEETDDSIYFAVGDCTGHGVPGAFMSILGFNQLDQAIRQERIEKPGEILEYLDRSISSLLNQKGSKEEVEDGMDIVICRYLKNEKLIEYAAANRHLLISRSGKIERLRGDRKSIGGTDNYTRCEFNTYTYEPTFKETFFLTTDGYGDQFGGKNDKKLKSKGLESYLESTVNADSKDAEKILMRSFLKWKGSKEQVDDVCILGVSMEGLMKNLSRQSLKTVGYESN